MAITYSSTNNPLQFYRGLHQNLPKTSADIKEGAFYLTTDSNRFYVGSKKGNTNYLQELNQSITSVSNIAAFRTLLSQNEAEEGRFYYCINENVLAVVHNNEVIQINPDHNETLNSHELKVTTITSGITIGSLVETDAGKKLEGGFDLLSDSPTNLKFEVSTNDTYRETEDTLLNPTKTYYTASVSGSTTTYTQVTQIENSIESFESGVTYYEKFKSVKVIPATYSFSGTKNGNNYKLTLGKTLTDGTTNDTDIAVIAGNNISFDSSGNNSLQISAVDSNISGVTASFASNDSGAITIGVTSASNGSGSATAEFIPQIKYGKDSSNQSTAKFDKNGILTLDVYTKGQLDNEIASKLREYNALYYRGSVTAATGIAASTIESIIKDSVYRETEDTLLDSTKTYYTASVSEGVTTYTQVEDSIESFESGVTYYEKFKTGTGVHNGDVYVAQNDFVFNDNPVRTGDLLIAQGTEGDDGIIPSANVTWTIIQSGNDFISVERVTGNAGGFNIKQNNLSVESIRIVADEDAENLTVSTGYVDSEHQTGIQTTVNLVWGEFTSSGS